MSINKSISLIIAIVVVMIIVTFTLVLTGHYTINNQDVFFFDILVSFIINFIVFLIVFFIYDRVNQEKTKFQILESEKIIKYGDTFYPIKELIKNFKEKKPNFSNLVLDGIDLSNMDVSELDFSDTTFKGANLQLTNFRNCNLARAEFTNAELPAINNFKNANMYNVNLNGAFVSHSNWYQNNVKIEGLKHFESTYEIKENKENEFKIVLKSN